MNINNGPIIAKEAPDPRILILGHQGVGKTALLSRLTRNMFSPATSSTRGVQVEPLELLNGRQTAFMEVGVDSLDSLNTLLLSQPICVLVVIDARQNMIEADISHWRTVLNNAQFAAPPELALVVTKIDVHPINTDLVNLAQTHGFGKLFKTSARTSDGFSDLTSYIINDIHWPKLEDDVNPVKAAIIVAIRDLTEKLCTLIAKDADALMHIEWRQLEQVVAASLEAVGFIVDLTPSSKDGGKDIIVTLKQGNRKEVYYVEIKHWREGGRLGMSHISNFIQVNIRDKTNGGLFLSSSGYTSAVHSRLAEITQKRVSLGSSQKIVSLCQHFVWRQEGCWVPQSPLAILLAEKTLDGPMRHNNQH